MNIEKIKVYMNMAKEIAKLSHDSEKKVGAIMLSRSNRIIATSFNGFVRNAKDKDLPSKRPDKYEYIIHAEANMIYNCAHEGIRTKDTTIICTLSPCLSCLRACYQAGVKTMIYEEKYSKINREYCDLIDIEISEEKIDNKYTKLTFL